MILRNYAENFCPPFHVLYFVLFYCPMLTFNQIIKDSIRTEKFTTVVVTLMSTCFNFLKWNWVVKSMAISTSDSSFKLAMLNVSISE